MVISDTKCRDTPDESTNDAESSRGPRLQSLDTLRAVAVLLVLGRHIPDISDSGTQFGGVFLRVWQRGGWIGVDLFFVLSGFLVSGLLFSEYREQGTISVKRFLIRRGLKLYPAFYAMLAVMCMLVYLVSGYVPADRVLAEALFLRSYLPGLANHTWSLGVEEHFYIGLPLVFATMIRWGHGERPFQWLPAMCIVSAAAILGLRIVNALNGPYSDATHLFPTHLRVDSLLSGVLLAYGFHFYRSAFINFCRQNRVSLACFGAIGLVPFFIFMLETTPLIYSVGLSVAYLSSGAILMSALGQVSGKEPAGNPVIRLLSWVGYHSYSIYLWHMLVLNVLVPVTVRRIGSIPPLEVYVAIYVFEAILFGIVAARVIEVPVLRMRDRLWPSRTRGAVAEVAVNGATTLPARGEHHITGGNFQSSGA